MSMGNYLISNVSESPLPMLPYLFAFDYFTRPGFHIIKLESAINIKFNSYLVCFIPPLLVL
jgi:hypothetical protein